MISRIRDSLINLMLRAMNLLPYPFTHNLEKAATLRKVFWHIGIEALPGDYFEFGVAFGNSLQSAVFASRSAKADFLGVQAVGRKFFGFDTFEEFASDDPDDLHETWAGEKFSFSFSTVSRRFHRHPAVRLFKGDVTQLGVASDFREVVDSATQGSLVAVAMLDMDLKGPTSAALEWLAPRLQSGSVLIFDELFAFRGSYEKGEMGALGDFLAMHPEISLREFSSYGDGGRVFQVQIGQVHREIRNLRAL